MVLVVLKQMATAGLQAQQQSSCNYAPWSTQSDAMICSCILDALLKLPVLYDFSHDCRTHSHRTAFINNTTASTGAWLLCFNLLNIEKRVKHAAGIFSMCVNFCGLRIGHSYRLIVVFNAGQANGATVAEASQQRAQAGDEGAGAIALQRQPQT